MLKSDIEKSLGNTFLKKATKIEVGAKTILLEQGKVSKKMFYIEKGCVRLSTWANDRDITFNFFFETNFISSFESFFFNTPSSFSVETLEPCILYYMSKTDFQEMMDQSEGLKVKTNDFLYQKLIYYKSLFLAFISNNPKERYEKLLKEYPFIFKRVPQHYIASYLGITSVSLSRIRNKK